MIDEEQSWEAVSIRISNETIKATGTDDMMKIWSEDWNNAWEQNEMFILSHIHQLP